jgi:hypothetical protein
MSTTLEYENVHRVESLIPRAMMRTPLSAMETVVNQQMVIEVNSILYCVRTPVPQFLQPGHCLRTHLRRCRFVTHLVPNYGIFWKIYDLASLECPTFKILSEPKSQTTLHVSTRGPTMQRQPQASQFMVSHLLCITHHGSPKLCSNMMNNLQMP